MPNHIHNVLTILGTDASTCKKILKSIQDDEAGGGVEKIEGRRFFIRCINCRKKQVVGFHEFSSDGFGGVWVNGMGIHAEKQAEDSQKQNDNFGGCIHFFGVI